MVISSTEQTLYPVLVNILNLVRGPAELDFSFKELGGPNQCDIAGFLTGK